MANLIFRITQNELQIPGATSTKNAPLTNAEIDGNFISIKKFITEFDASYVTQGTFPVGRINDTAHGTRGGGTQHSAVTTTVNGFMIAADKLKLNGVAESANNYAHPTQTALSVTAANGLVVSAITINTLGHVTAVSNKTLAAVDIPNLDTAKITTGFLAAARFNDTSHGARAGGTTHAAVTTLVNGFMSFDDKVKLNTVATSANNYAHPTGGANTTLAAGNGIVLSSVTVNSLGHVTAIASKTLAAADIPTAISITGNAATATILATTRAINGTNFNGSAAITTDIWGTARTLTIGSSGKSVNGSVAVSWTLAEIGLATDMIRKVTVSTSAPTGGVDGDLWMRY